MREHGQKNQPRSIVSSEKMSSPTHEDVVGAIKNQQAGKQFSARALSNTGLISAYGGDTEIASLPNKVREHLQQAYGENFGSLKTLRDITKIGPEGKIEDSIFPEDPELAKERSKGLSAVSGQIPELAGNLLAQKSAVDELQRKKSAFAALSGALNAFKAKSGAKDLSKPIHKSTASSLKNLFGDQVPATYGDIPDREMLAKTLADKGALEALGLTEADFSGTGNPFDAPYQRTKKAVERLHANTYDRFDPEGIGSTTDVTALEKIEPGISDDVAMSLLRSSGREDLVAKYRDASDSEKNAILSEGGLRSTIDRPRNLYPTLEGASAANRFVNAGKNSELSNEHESEAQGVVRKSGIRRLKSVDKVDQNLAKGGSIYDAGSDEQESLRIAKDYENSITSNVLNYMGLGVRRNTQVTSNQLQGFMEEKGRGRQEVSANEFVDRSGGMSGEDRVRGGRVDEENDMPSIYGDMADVGETVGGDEPVSVKNPLTGKDMKFQGEVLALLDSLPKNYRKNAKSHGREFVLGKLSDPDFMARMSQKHGGKLNADMLSKEIASDYIDSFTSIAEGDSSNILSENSPFNPVFIKPEISKTLRGDQLSQSDDRKLALLTGHGTASELKDAIQKAISEGSDSPVNALNKDILRLDIESESDRSITKAEYDLQVLNSTIDDYLEKSGVSPEEFNDPLNADPNAIYLKHYRDKVEQELSNARSQRNYLEEQTRPTLSNQDMAALNAQIGDVPTVSEAPDVDERRLYLPSKERADEFEASMPGIERIGDSTFYLRKEDVDSITGSGLLKPGDTVLLERLYGENLTNNWFDKKRKDGTHDTIVFRFTPEGESPEDTLDTADTIVQEAQALGVDARFNSSTGEVEIVKPFGRSTEFYAKLAEFADLHGDLVKAEKTANADDGESSGLERLLGKSRSSFYRARS